MLPSGNQSKKRLGPPQEDVLPTPIYIAKIRKMTAFAIALLHVFTRVSVSKKLGGKEGFFSEASSLFHCPRAPGNFARLPYFSRIFLPFFFPIQSEASNPLCVSAPPLLFSFLFSMEENVAFLHVQQNFLFFSMSEKNRRGKPSVFLFCFVWRNPSSGDVDSSD